MVFAEFQILSTGWNPEKKDFSGPKVPIPMCGSSGCYRLDARKTLENQMNDARQQIGNLTAVAPHIVGYRIFRSPNERWSEGKPVTDVIFVDED
jgi:hypothetical protein